MSSPEVVIYTKFGCGYCFRAKRLLDSKGVAYTEHDVSFDPKLRDEMISRSGRSTFPQIFCTTRFPKSRSTGVSPAGRCCDPVRWAKRHA